MSVDPKTQSLFDAISTVNYDRVKLLIDSGVAINSPNERGQTPLAMAYLRGNIEIADLLVAAGAQMKAQTELTESFEEVTYAFDLDEVFAANEILDSSEMFVDSELTMTSLNQSTQQLEFEPSETYAFDLSKDLDRLTIGAMEEPDGLSIPMGEWESNETYVMDLDSFDLFAPEEDEHEVTSPQQGVLASFEPLSASGVMSAGVGSSLNVNSSVTSVEMLQQIVKMDNLSLVEEKAIAAEETWGEGETYAVDLDDLNLAKLMTGMDLEIQSIGAPSLLEQQQILADIDSSLFPVIAGEGESDYDADTEDSIELIGHHHSNQDNLTPTYEPNATNTSLMAATIDGDLDLVKQSIEAGANLDGYDWNLSYAPLGMAIDRGYLPLVECLLTAGANPHCGSIATTALGLAAERGEAEIIQLLLTRRVDVNTPVGADGWTALLAAIENGHRSIVQLLVTAGANVNVWSRGETPILLAAKCEERDIYNYLYPLVNTAIRLCADRDGEQLLQATNKRRIRQQNRPVEKFIEMATKGNVEEVKRAIEIGIEIDELGAKGYTALMVAAYYGHRSIVKMLLAAGANPSLLSDDDGLGVGMTALILAAGSFFASNRQEIVKLLIAGGADPNQRGFGGKTAIFAAAIAGSGYKDCVETLIAAGADLDLRDDRGYTALTAVAAAENYQMLNLLMQAGASTAGLDSIQLIQAAGIGNIDRVKSLLAGNVNLNFDRGAAIGNAAAGGHAKIVELLIRAGANVNLRDKLGFTPIASAAYLGYGEIVNLLIAAGADTQAPAGEAQSYSALEYAQMGLYRAVSPAEIQQRNRGTSATAELSLSTKGDDLQHAQIIKQLEHLGAH
jgi:ankyrin repeat protein